MADIKFIVKNKKFPAVGVTAVVPSDDGCTVRWIDGRVETFRGITSQELLFKIDEAKASTDSD